MSFWSRIFGLFSGLFKPSRYKEEKREYKDERGIARLTQKEEHIEIDENKIIKQIIKLLEEISRILRNPSKGDQFIEVQIGNELIRLQQPVEVLMNQLKELENTQISVHAEESKLDNMRSNWAIINQGLSRFVHHLDETNETKNNMGEIKGKVPRINKLFEELGIFLEEEEEISKEKLQLMKDAYQLILKEQG